MQEDFTRVARAYGHAPRRNKYQIVMAQNEAIVEYAERERIGLPFTNFFEDESSFTAPFVERPKANALLEELKIRQFQHLIVTRIDLLGRGPCEVLETVKVFQKSRVTIHLLDLGGIVFDEHTATGKAAVALIAWAAQTEANYQNRIDDHAEAIQSKLDAKREQGQLTGSVPYGWNVFKTGKITDRGVKVRELVDNPEEQKWILRMIELRSADWGWESIAKELNRQGVKSKHGKQWHALSVRKLIGPQKDGKTMNRTIRDWLAARDAK